MEKTTKILVVDDDSGIGEMLKTLLEFYGYEVDVTEKPLKAEELIQEKNIDIVLLDMLISGVDGTDVCAGIRQNPEISETPVLMMSALHDAGPKCKKAGANDFIAKPFEVEDLTERIEKILADKE
ncbi:response regulator [Salegentibacter mishustinae]|jgi:DNA-binding response OmpR family regulator|uniref:Two-component system response regulator n=1 Tax=Salegentibacter mishustinae TaxID=270918 RepID=A0A0Q9ZQ56_9FLAO|nr:response regulator [Salegentibacter mishustinae]KRG30755.1 two-component system response regulator [Salegentibacter mishustinae]MDX1426411.1 response regulator [Salegentibacter mishustinae]PNW23644.1 two-component system response regulator [Salegentibacter mishustinae]PZX66732.1 response regulator receiver domain-containing protein [Salegentibacter mishustinae]UBZ08652.1 response regulator [Salegentibacter mishustinae]|tara:strand:- start:214 stop:588 length:375 start_codon:yes stop_codon:yes gene_type:complete